MPLEWMRRLRRENETTQTARKPEHVAQGTVVRSEVQTPDFSLTVGRFAIGERVADTYEIRRQLGEGGMGVVYLARQLQWDQDVVLKVPQAELAADSVHRQRIVREAEAWTDLGLHPHIANCHYVHPVNDVLLLVVEHVDGGNLRDWIADGRCADLRVGLNLAIQFCHGLEHAHVKRLIHRDIKPENVLLTKDGTLKITDFGIASTIGGQPGASSIEASASTPEIASDLNQTLGWGVGTAGYMAPEQWLGTRKVDERSDLFGFGVCLYEMFCGWPPFEERGDDEWQRWALDPQQRPRDPQALRGMRALPARLANAMQRCVDWDHDRRPAGVADVRRELCAIYEEEFGDCSSFAELSELPPKADELNNRGVSFLALGRKEDALACWKASIELDAQHLETTYNRGVALWRNGTLTDDALLERLGDIRKNFPERWEGGYLVALVHLERGDLESAQHLLELAARHPEAHTQVAEALRLATSGTVPKVVTLNPLEGHTGSVHGISLSADGRGALTGSGGIDDNTVRLWDLRSRRSTRVFTEHNNEVGSVCLSDDGAVAVSSSWDGEVRFWNMRKGRCLRNINLGSSVCVHLSADGRFAISASDEEDPDGVVLRLWNVATGECLKVVGRHGTSVSAVCLSSDGRLALSAAADTLRLWDTASGSCIRSFTCHGLVSSVSLSTDARFALSGSWDRTLRLWEVSSGDCLRTFEGHTGLVHAVSLSADGNRAFSGGDDRTVRVWDTRTARCLRTLKCESPIHCVSLSHDGSLALAGEIDGAVRVWSLPGELRPSCSSYLCRVRPLTESQLTDRRASQLLERAEHAVVDREFSSALTLIREARQLPGHERTPRNLAAWKRLSLGCIRSHLRAAWLRSELTTDTAEVDCACLNRDATLALSGSRSRQRDTLRLWDVATGRCVHSFGGTRNEVSAVSMSSDGMVALCGAGLGGPVVGCEHRAQTGESASMLIGSDERRCERRRSMGALLHGAYTRCGGELRPSARSSSRAMLSAISWSSGRCDIGVSFLRRAAGPFWKPGWNSPTVERGNRALLEGTACASRYGRRHVD
jgi:serine/threonine protein kinase/WD40 repeat protein